MPDPWEGRKKLLAVADVQTGYHHDSISHALATLERLGRASGAFVTNLRTDSQLLTKRPILGVGSKYGGKPVNARGLADYDAVFLLPSGAGSLSEEQKADLLSFVRDDGKGLLIGHAGALAFFEWPEFLQLTGTRMAGEVMATCEVIVEAPEVPGALAFGGRRFSFHEQHPLLAEPRAAGQVVMRLDPASVPPDARGARADGDYPVVWTVRCGRGRVYNLGWGHLESTWDDPRFQELVLGAVRWAMERDEAGPAQAIPAPG